MKATRADSPYLKEPQRLEDVIAAIQAMGTYKFYKLSFERWSRRISGTKGAEDHWKRVIEEHPEFFRVTGDDQKASLVWRRSYPRRYHVDSGRELSQEEYDALSEEEKQNRISRIPLGSADIATLVSTAIDMHARALEVQKDDRWWIPLGASLIGVVLGGGISIVSSLL